MSFTTYIPVDILKPFVKSIAISVNDKAESYKVLPDTSIVMGFQFSGDLSFSHKNGLSPLSKAGVTGLMSSYRIFNSTENTGSVLVMFTEVGAAAFFDYAMHEIFNESFSLDNLILRSQMDIVVEKLCEATGDLMRISVIEEFLISKLHYKANDELVIVAVSIIKQCAGNIRITELSKRLFISQSQLEKRFRKIVGSSPKKFASIVRINSLTKASAQRNGLINLALDAGYFDQAHFIKDFKSFTGQTPEQFFSKK
jgi:AraC-like DNA-binding protein